MTYREAKAKFEKEYLIRKLKESEGNVSETAKITEIERSHLHRKLRTFGIDAQDFRKK